MKLKRTIGMGKIFFYSCGAVLALAGIVWLIINGVYAVYISGDEPTDWEWFSSYTKNAADIATPWLLMAAAMAIYYRYCKMCSANNISCTKQTGVFVLLSMFISAVFAAADLLFAKLVLQPLYGGIITTRFEYESAYFWYIIKDYVRSFEEDVPQTLSPYAINTVLLLFALMTLYYYCFFLAGCYIMQCFRCRKKKLLIYYAFTTACLIFMTLADSVIESALGNMIIEVYGIFVITMTLTNPFIFLFMFPYMAGSDIGMIAVFLTIFILITIASIEGLGLGQFPSKRKIKKILKNYSAKKIAEREEH